jgi:2-dehydropantoate 2-reductase
MRIAVIGAGAVGGTIAALLDRAGHEVSITARGAQLEAVRTNGLALSGAWGEHVARPEAHDRLVETPELAFVCTKAQDAARAIQDNRSLLGGAPVVIVQNGLDGVRVGESLLAGSPVVGAIALYAASYLRPGLIDVTAAGPTFIGVDDPARRDVADRVSGVLGEAMPTRLVGDFRGAQWSKLIVNQVNAMPAITGLSAQATLRHPVLGRIVAASMREAVRIGLATGVHFASLQGLSQPLLRAYSVSPLWPGPWRRAWATRPIPDRPCRASDGASRPRSTSSTAPWCGRPVPPACRLLSTRNSPSWCTSSKKAATSSVWRKSPLSSGVSADDVPR